MIWYSLSVSVCAGATVIESPVVRQIAELDAEHEAGHINHDVYQRRRTQLKARLAELIDQNDPDEV
jgi:hypothetical protein